MATTQDTVTLSATQDAILEDHAAISQVVHGDLIAQQQAYQQAADLDTPPLYSSDPSESQRYAQWLDKRSFSAEVLEEIKQFIVDCGGDTRYVATLLLGATHIASDYMGLIIEFNKATGDLSITWSYLDLREPTSEALERGSFGC